MREPTRTLMRRSVPLWIGAGLLATLNLVAAMLPGLTNVALACSGLFALYGIGFGIWTGRQLAAPVPVRVVTRTRRSGLHR